MSVSFDGYLIDLDRFCSFVGGHDHQIVAAAQNKIAESPYFRRDSEGDREIALAVQNFVDGRFEELHQNLHKRDWMLLAMNGICFTYGECLDNALLNCVHSDLLDELGRGADLLFNRGAPFVMSQADLRGCMGYLKNSEISEMRDEIEQIQGSFPDDGDPEVLETIESMIDWYDHALETGNDLIGFWN